MGRNFDNFTVEINDWDKINVNIQMQIHLFNRVKLSLKKEKLIFNQILSPKLWY